MVPLKWYRPGPRIHFLANPPHIDPQAFAVVQLPHHVWLFATPWTATRQASLSFTISLSLLKLISVESLMISNHLILCCPLLLLPSIFPASGSFLMSQFFASGFQSIGVSVIIIPSNEYQGWFYFKIDWFDLLAGQRTLKSLLQHRSSKASILLCSAFFRVHSHIHTWLLKKP